MYSLPREHTIAAMFSGVGAHAHGLPQSTEITAKLVKQLTAAAASEN